jgi:hypothetical protein
MKKLPIFYNALMLTGVNLLLRLVSTSFQVFISGRIGAAGVGLLQLVMSVGAMAMTAGIAGIRTATMYLTAEELGRKRPGNVNWVLSACLLYSIVCSGAVAAALRIFAPFLAEHWVGNIDTVENDLAGGGHFKQVQGTQECGLTGTGGADDNNDLTLLNIGSYIIKCVELSMIEVLGKSLNADECIISGHCSSASFQELQPAW